MKAAPTVAVVAVVAFGVGLVAAVRLAPPSDLGRWAPVALSGEVVLAMAGRSDGVLVGTSRGLQLLAPDGTVVDLGIPGPVRALAGYSGGTFVGTDDGLLDLPETTAGREDGQIRTVLDGTAVNDVHVTGEEVVVGAATGLFRRTAAGRWDQLWPPAARQIDDEASPQPAQAGVDAALATTDGVLFSHPDGLAFLDGAGQVEVVVRDVAVVELHHDERAALLWAGTRGGPLLLVSDDAGRTWRPRADGLGLSAVEVVARPPSGGDTIVVGGSGLADGTGNAGTETSTDGGLTWQTRQDRLSNTHVYDLLARSEPWALEARLVGTDARLMLPLPVSTTRLYAGTNGGGVSTQRPAVPALDAIAGASPLLRLIEPVLFGALLLVVVLPAYRHLWRGNSATPRPPPTEATLPTEAPSTHHPKHEEN